MPQSLPQFELEIRQSERGPEVWDGIRRQWYVLTPEEHVRQCLILYLNEFCGVPKGLLSLERGLQYDRRRKRYDLLVFGRNGQPLILCECKEPRVPIDQAVVHQITTYNSKIGAKILLLTNGPQLMAFSKTVAGEWLQLELPFQEPSEGESWFDAVDATWGK